jgi:putative sterol carrier protein
MTREELMIRLRDAEAWIPGKRTCIDFGDSGTIHLDGETGEVGEQCRDPHTTIRIGWDNWQKIVAGTLDPMTAYMTGKLAIEGEMGTAMQLAARLAAHRKG